jgi:hypothetical protein
VGAVSTHAGSAGDDLGAALARTHVWFEAHSGWAPPDPGTLADWAAEGACRAPDECWVARRGVCGHGLVSWQVVLDSLAAHDATSAPPAGHGPEA